MKRKNKVWRREDWRRAKRLRRGATLPEMRAVQPGTGPGWSKLRQYLQDGELWTQYADGCIGSALADGQGRILISDEGTCTAGGVYRPDVLPAKIRHWWIGVNGAGCRV